MTLRSAATGMIAAGPTATGMTAAGMTATPASLWCGGN
jgi:hypothetical protein